MEELRIKDMSYSMLLSHTFPGLLLTSEIILFIQLFTGHCIINFLNTIQNNVQNVIAGLILLFVSATLLGFILDGIHHWWFEDRKWIIEFNRSRKFIKLLKKEEPPYSLELFDVIRTSDQMHIYKHFLEHDFWYPYEAYANIAIAMLPGIVLLPFWLSDLNVSLWAIITLVIVSILVFCAMYYEAKTTHEFFKNAEKKIIQNFNNSNKNTNPPS